MEKTLRKYFPLFALPALICFALAFLIPMVWGFILSFCEFSTITDATFVGFSNYVKAFTVDNYFTQAFWFTLGFTIVTVITINIVAFALALALTRGIPGTNAFRTIFFMPNLIGGIVLGWIWQVVLNGVLAGFEQTLLSDSKYGFWGLVVLMNWQKLQRSRTYRPTCSKLPQ